MMDNFVKDEAAKVNAIDTWSDMEYQVQAEIAAWIKQQPIKFNSMYQACNAYWHERLYK